MYGRELIIRSSELFGSGSEYATVFLQIRLRSLLSLVRSANLAWEMRMRSRRFPCLMITGLALFVLVAGGILVALFATGLPGLLVSDPSYVLMASPLDHASVLTGEPVYLRVSAELSHRNFAGVALYVDGGRYALDQKMQPYAPKNTVNCASSDARYCGAADLTVLWMPTEPGQCFQRHSALRPGVPSRHCAMQPLSG